MTIVWDIDNTKIHVHVRLQVRYNSTRALCTQYSFIVPVLDLYEVADETVRCTTLHKVPPSTEECFRVRVSKLFMEVSQEREAWSLLLDLMQGDGIHYRLYETTIVTNHHQLVPEVNENK